MPEYRQGQLAQFQRLDQDADNIVEYAGLPRKVAKRFRRMDPDQDGRLTRPEFERALLVAFDKADANDDGILEVSEQH